MADQLLKYGPGHISEVLIFLAGLNENVEQLRVVDDQL